MKKVYLKASARNYFLGMKVSSCIKQLQLIAKQNGLLLNRKREYDIARNILAKSIVNN